MRLGLIAAAPVHAIQNYLPATVVPQTINAPAEHATSGLAPKSSVSFAAEIIADNKDPLTNSDRL